MSSKRKVVTIAITVAALTVGTVGSASAFEHKGKKISITKSSVKVTKVGGEKHGMYGMYGAPSAQLDSLLSGLVTSGTLTQVQVDAIKRALTDARAAVLVVEATKRIDAAVTAGKLTAAQATTAKAALVAQITASVSATPEAAFLGGQKRGHGQGEMNRNRKGMGNKH